AVELVQPLGHRPAAVLEAREPRRLEYAGDIAPVDLLDQRSLAREAAVQQPLRDAAGVREGAGLGGETVLGEELPGLREDALAALGERHARAGAARSGALAAAAPIGEALRLRLDE